MDAEVAAQIGAQRGERNQDRVTQRNGYRSRPWDTRVGTMALRIPKIRKGSYFQSLLEAGRRSQKALLSVVQQACVEAVSTRRVDGLTNAMGCDGISKVRCLASVETYTRWWRISGPTRGRRSSSLCMGGRVTPEGGEGGRIVTVRRGDGSRRCLATCRTAYIQLSPEDVQAYANTMLAQLRERFPTAAPMNGLPVASCGCATVDRGCFLSIAPMAGS